MAFASSVRALVASARALLAALTPSRLVPAAAPVRTRPLAGPIETPRSASKMTRLLAVIALLAPAVLTLSLAPAPAHAGVLDEALVAKINRAAPGETITGLIMLSEQLDLAQCEREMAARGITTRWRRHEYVIRAAQELAQRTQGGLLSEVRSLTGQGEISEYHPFWVANVIAITAKPSAFLPLSLRPDVGVIYANVPVELRSELASTGGSNTDRPTDKDSAVLQDNLVAVNVQHAWDLGYTGGGRLVCDIDTGADGSHPAYATRWRGAQPGIPWQQAWFDPYFGSEFPFDAQSHGTHTLGIMVAHPPDADPLGIAPDAEWIAAGALLSWDVVKIISCFEWAADPDGNPSTIEDVPDVANNSWGTSDNCASTFWGAIDVVEAAGVANIIAVDNTGPAPESVNSPESRAVDQDVNFGIGNIDPHTAGYPIAYSSGRGPSPCDHVSIKPNMTAPGTAILSSIPGGGYSLKTGCSMAAPHVSGACALLREVNPSLTVTQMKDALLATAVDLGTAGPDNDYGWGLLNVGAAVDYILLHNPPLPPPRSLTGVAFPDSGAALRWLRPSGVAPGNPPLQYRIYRASGEDPYPAEPLATVPPLTLFYFDHNNVLGTYRYVVTAAYASGESEPSNELLMDLRDPSSVGGGAPGIVPMLSAGPNPFTSWTTLRLVAGSSAGAAEGAGVGAAAGTGGRARKASFDIFDAGGRKVRSLRAEGDGGNGTAMFDGRDEDGRLLPAGVYYARAGGSGRTGALPLVIVR